MISLCILYQDLLNIYSKWSSTVRNIPHIQYSSVNKYGQGRPFWFPTVCNWPRYVKATAAGIFMEIVRENTGRGRVWCVWWMGRITVIQHNWTVGWEWRCRWTMWKNHEEEYMMSKLHNCIIKFVTKMWSTYHALSSVICSRILLYSMREAIYCTH